VKREERSTSLERRLLAYGVAAAAGAAASACAAGRASADPMHVDPADVTLDASLGGADHDLDLNGDGVVDFRLTTLNLMGGGELVLTCQGENQVVETDERVGNPAPLEPGDAIGPGSPFVGPAAYSMASWYSSTYPFAYGAWPGVEDGYLGVKFHISGNVHYGWIRLSAAARDPRATLKDWAWESTPGESIDAGEGAEGGFQEGSWGELKASWRREGN
jgi:hypothetical protein